MDCCIYFLLMGAKDPTYYGLLYACAVFYGLGRGGVNPIVSVRAADIFCGKSFGSIYELTTVGFAIGGAVGSWLADYIFKVAGDYIRTLVLINISFLI